MCLFGLIKQRGENRKFEDVTVEAITSDKEFSFPNQGILIH